MKQILPISLFLSFLLISYLPANAHRVDDGIKMERPTIANSDYEKKVLDILTDIQANQYHLNVPRYDGRFIRVLTESINAQHVVEVGTGNGYSSIWMGLALKQTGGTMTTFEIDPERVTAARMNFKHAEMDDIITVIEGDAHETITTLKDPIDILFLDADKKGYVDYLEKTLPLIRPGGLIIAHNIEPNMADPLYLKAVTENSALETVIRGGVGITLKKR